MPYCTNCGTETGNAKFCPECGTPATPRAGSPEPDPGIGARSGAQRGAPGAGPAQLSIDPRLAGAIAYFPPLAILFLFAEPHKSVRFVRFHSFQSIFLAVGLAVVAIGFGIISLVPFLGWIAGLFGFFLPLVWVVLAVWLGVKAYSGREPHLPIIGDLADKQC